MPTKREVMAAGTAAPLARMLGSDLVLPVIPAGTDQASATQLEANAVLLQPTANNQGVRLPAARGKYFYILRNPSGAHTVLVYPHGSEIINARAPGGAWPIGPSQTALFVPASNRWIAGTMITADNTQLGGPLMISGPRHGGGAWPPANTVEPGQLFVCEVSAWSDFLFNCYYDAQGNARYTTDGFAASMSFDPPGTEAWGANGMITFWLAPRGLAGQPIPLANFLNSVQIGTPPSGAPWPPAAPGSGGGQLMAGVAVGCQTDFAFNWFYDAQGRNRYRAAGLGAGSLSFDVGPQGSVTIWVAPLATAAGQEIVPNSWDDVAAFSHSSGFTAPNTTGLSLLYRIAAGAAGLRFAQVQVGAPVSAANAPTLGVPTGARVLYVVDPPGPP